MSSPEVRKCQNCRNSFEIEAQDFGFYEKVKIPSPTWCPDCRTQRRMTWRNERSLYRREDAGTGKPLISCFAPDSGVQVYERDHWWSDEWDPLASGAEYDWDQPFFLQFRKLLERTPMPALFISRSVNSDYCNHSGEVRECYLTHACWAGERLNFCAKTVNSRDSMDTLGTTDSELVYEDVTSYKMYKTAFCEDSENCSNSMFLYQCRGCDNCFGCTNLRGKSYYFFNQPCSKEEYEKKIKELDLGSYKNLLDAKKRFEAEKVKTLRKFANFHKTENVTGDNVSETSNCHYCFDVRDETRDSKFCINGGMHMNDTYDGYGVGERAELMCEIVDTGANGSMFLFDIFVWGGQNVQYSYACHGCQNVFGCIGLRNKQYCILNKQYSKEEFESLLPKIIEQMKIMPYVDRMGRSFAYGEFFPPELSPFAYNETIAQEYFPLAEEEAEKLGYKWREPEGKNYSVSKEPENLPDNIRDADDAILNETIRCAHAKAGCKHQCTSAFKLIPAELAFYRRMGLPLPRLCPNCRHYARLARRNPIRLWHRACMCQGENKTRYSNTVPHAHGSGPCPNEFETSYAPGRPETVYCEQCYQAEVA